ncbi:MAG: hypothetical protein KIT80_14390 [Chitinophagaceae bacterium]|nr:hypothetical protein [Chitinophagaceae bacterium]MCW5928102.1 hypothetical protein [Chitinophagaceae bacterium]
MKLTKRQIIMGSIKPLLVCLGMYLVVLFASVFVCSSLYNAVKGNKSKAAVQTKAPASVAATSQHFSQEN